jgi:hypothetical protein
MLSAVMLSVVMLNVVAPMITKTAKHRFSTLEPFVLVHVHILHRNKMAYLTVVDLATSA